MLTPSDYGSPVEEERGGHVPWLPGENPGDLMPKLVHRRAKRIIPDDEKDDKYWEKRKRNNMVSALPLVDVLARVTSRSIGLTAVSRVPAGLLFCRWKFSPRLCAGGSQP